MDIAVPAVEEAFRAHGDGSAQMPPKVYIDLPQYHGDFRAMPAYMNGIAGVKWVNSHPENPARHGLPSVMGVYILNDPDSAFPLCIMDGTILTAFRTGAAAGVASKYLASAPKTLGIVGCGVQARYAVDAHLAVFPDLRVLAADANPEAAERLAGAYGGEVASVERAAGCDVVTTITPSRTPVVRDAWVREGAHINALGADAPGKQEIESAVLKRAAIVLDDMEQASHSGEVNVPLHDGTLGESDIFGTLGDIVCGKVAKPDQGRLTVFDSTGLALQDAALAHAVYIAAKKASVGHELDLIGVC